VIGFSDVTREARFLVASRTTRGAWLGLGVLCVLALLLGHAEITRQIDTIERARAQDRLELQESLEGASDYGGAAYAAFSLTWDRPSDAAFLAIGQRDVSPWMLRVRALALEGQIHESDNFNPELSLAGRFDYAFVIAFLLPLFLIALLYDLHAVERDSGRVAMLTATVGAPRRLWLPRIAVLMAGAALACLLPLWILGLAFGAEARSLVQATGVVVAQLVLWSALASAVAFGAWTASVSAALLTASWLVLALLLPLTGKILIDRTVPGIEGAQISLLQRETVNAAWDLPRSVTLDRFYASHPQWAHSAPLNEPFHWKWYYAFQQVGDETAAPLSHEYRSAIRERDRRAGWVAWLSPPVAVMRGMQAVARTDMRSALEYDRRIREYHGQIRNFFYPVLFEEVPFSQEKLAAFPLFGDELDAERSGAGTDQLSGVGAVEQPQ
jgi:ABC-2 type transport system permease protein